VYARLHPLSSVLAAWIYFTLGGEFPRPRHSAHDHSVCASCSALCRGRYAPNLNYTRLGSEPPRPRRRARRWTANGQARLSTQLLRRPTVRLSSRRSPMPQRVAPIVGAWGAAGTDSVSTPIDRSAARRARPGWVYFTWGGEFPRPRHSAHEHSVCASCSALCRGRYAPNLNYTRLHGFTSRGGKTARAFRDWVKRSLLRRKRF
jgi:hypothetical protein